MIGFKIIELFGLIPRDDVWNFDMKLKKIVTGGQSGVDRAALDVAIVYDFPYGGWCPKGRKAEDGLLAAKYQLQETATTDYAERTKLNLTHSDGTLVIVASLPITVTDGTNLTLSELKKINKPYFLFNLSGQQTMEDIINWLDIFKIETLNIAGPRESQSPGIYQQSYCLLTKLIALLKTSR